MIAGIYKITNTINGKIYIGSAVKFKQRFYRHKSHLNTNSHHSQRLQLAWNKYGPDAFKFEPILICAKEDLLFYEQRCLDVYKPEYNICKTAGSNLGTKRSKETKAKMSAAQRLRGGITPEQRKKMEAGRMVNGVIVVSAETRKKLSEKNKLYVHTEEARRKISISSKGRKLSHETRAKISAAQNQPHIKEIKSRTHKKPKSEEHKLKIGAGNKGKKRSQEDRMKMSERMKKTGISPETRAKMIASYRANRLRKLNDFP